MRFAPGSLAIVASDWLLEHSDQAWLYRYGHRIEEGRFPRGQAERRAVAEVIGHDGFARLSDVFDPAAPVFVREIPAVEILRHIWIQNYHLQEGQVRWREQANIPPATQAHQLTDLESLLLSASGPFSTLTARALA